MTIIKSNSVIRNVSGINANQKKEIINFLQGNVYSWCKNNNNKWFSLKDLMGGVNFEWEGTPLYVLWEKHNSKGSNDPVKSAGKDAGWLLKYTLQIDKRNFKRKKGFTSAEYLFVS